MKSITLVILISVASTLVQAEGKDAPPGVATGTSGTTISTPSTILSNPSLMAGWKSYDDLGRPQELSTPGKRQFKSKNEFFLGVKSQAGFGLMAQGSEITQNYSAALPSAVNPSASGSKAGDPSLSFLHPIYSSERLMILGMAREYFPVTSRSTSQGIYQQAYYFSMLYLAHHGYDLFNLVVPRYFSQNTYLPTDGVFYTEDWTTISKRYRPWLRVGFGQHYQMETHNATPVGQTLELFPYADFMLTNTVYMGPRIYFPVAVQNNVYDAPTAVSINQIQAELFFQATL